MDIFVLQGVWINFPAVSDVLGNVDIGQVFSSGAFQYQVYMTGAYGQRPTGRVATGRSGEVFRSGAIASEIQGRRREGTINVG